MSDQDSISPYNINTKLNRNVMKIKKNITRGIISWSSIKILGTNIIRIVWHTVWQVTDKIYGVKRSSLHL